MDNIGERNSSLVIIIISDHSEFYVSLVIRYGILEGLLCPRLIDDDVLQESHNIPASHLIIDELFLYH